MAIKKKETLIEQLLRIKKQVDELNVKMDNYLKSKNLNKK